MAFFIKIEKIFEDVNVARYKFWPAENESRSGSVEIKKLSGETNIIDALPGDEQEIYGPRAARKIFMHWKKKEYPVRTSWAS